jgi:alpha-L-rhamnosidase
VKPIFLSFILCSIATLANPTMADQPNPAPPDTSWPAITPQNKPWVRWWWMGSAVDKPNLTRELEQIQSHGFGGVEVTPLYGANDYENKYTPFLTPQWMQMLQFTGEETKRLGLGLDMATGTGWPFGGPWITPENADAQLVRDTDKLSERPTRMKVKRAAPGDEGFVVNPYSITAIQAYLQPFTNAFDNFPHDLIRSQFHDSFEYSGNWSHELPAKFKEMHGYDLADHVKELWGDGDPDTVGRVLSDYRETLGQMHLDYLKTWIDWSHAHGSLAREQAHGAPGNLLDLYAAADIPETETFGSMAFPIPGYRLDPSDIGGPGPNPLASKFASSAAHVSGKNLASCETFTWLRDHFKASLAEMKPVADSMFLAGINHLVYHGCCYSPDDAQWPGWNFYAACEFNARNTIWRDIPAMNAYYARCQSILQSGKPDNDVLLYWPIYDQLNQPNSRSPEMRFAIAMPWLPESPFGKTAQWLTDHGYSFDYISDAQLLSRNDLNPYKAIVIPPTKTIPLPTLEKLIALAQSGATVIFQDGLPSDVPGLSDLQNRQAQLKSDLAKLNALQKDNSIKLHISKLDTSLIDAKIAREPMTDTGLKFIRRSYEDGYYYFIANLTDHEIKGWTALSVPTTSVLILNPLTSACGLAPTRNGASPQIYLNLKPGESLILRTFTTKKFEADPYPFPEPSATPVELTGTWHVDFLTDGFEPPADQKLPASFTTDKLASWTTLGDEEAKRFAGTARYTLEFDAPSTTADNYLLDLGDVRESARVTLNGQPVATLWSLPFQTPVGKFLHPGKNKLEIEVTNLAANRIRDLDQRGVVWKKFHEINYVNIHYRPFDASTWPLTDSGLLGPVKLIPMKNAQP